MNSQACFCTLFLGNVTFSGSGGDSKEDSFISEPYLWHLFKGSKTNKQEQEQGYRLESSDGKPFTRTSADNLA